MNLLDPSIELPGFPKKVSLLTEAERWQLSLPTPSFYIRKGLRYFLNATLRLLATAAESLILKPTYF